MRTAIVLPSLLNLLENGTPAGEDAIAEYYFLDGDLYTVDKDTQDIGKVQKETR